METKSSVSWPQVPLMGGGNHLWYRWHRIINDFSDSEREASREWPRWMYEAKKAAEEVPRLALLFERDRNGKLDKVFKPCACCSEGKHIENNHLTCCLGMKCKECPALQAIDRGEGTPEEKDWIKAWTCSGHILAKGGDVANEGFILTVDDRMFWDRVCEPLASEPPDITEQP